MNCPYNTYLNIPGFNFLTTTTTQPSPVTSYNTLMNSPVLTSRYLPSFRTTKEVEYGAPGFEAPGFIGYFEPLDHKSFVCGKKGLSNDMVVFTLSTKRHYDINLNDFEDNPTPGSTMNQATAYRPLHFTKR